jgi:hypothetical protein
MNGTTKDVMVLGNAQELRAGRFKSDFKMVWWRYSPQSSSIDQVVAISGQHLTIDGQEIANGSTCINYLSLRRFGDVLRGESDSSRDLQVQIMDTYRHLPVGGH